MAVEPIEKTKKQTVRTLATELNISHDTLIEFLQSKGFSSIKSIMSKIEDEALEIALKQFGKEKDVAEKRQKKVAAFKEKRTKTKTDAAPAEPEAKPAAPAPEPPAVIQGPEPEPVQELPEVIAPEAPV